MLSCLQGGSKAGVEAYRQEVDSHPLFAAADIQWKVSLGNADSFGLCPSCAPSPLVSAACQPLGLTHCSAGLFVHVDELCVRVVNEIITLDVPGLTVDLVPPLSLSLYQ